MLTQAHVLQVFTDSSQLHACRWLPAARPGSACAADGGPEGQLLATFLHVVRNTGVGWERLVQLLVAFCVMLAEGHACSVRQLRAAFADCPPAAALVAALASPPAAKAVALAVAALEATFERHAVARDSIIASCSVRCAWAGRAEGYIRECVCVCVG